MVIWNNVEIDNIHAAIKAIELLDEELQATKELAKKLKRKVEVATILIASNGARLVRDEATALYHLEVVSLDGTETGQFSSHSVPYYAVSNGIDEYIEWEKAYGNTTTLY